MPPLKPASVASAILHCKCPRCHEGDLFVHPGHYHLSGLLDMPDTCPVCGRDIQIEPGFYLGAMWVSYPLVMLLLIVSLLVSYLVFRLDLMVSFGIALALLLVLLPLILRYSRVLFLYLFARD